MGTEFLERVKGTIRRRLDRARSELTQRDLFSKQSRLARTTGTAHLHPGCTLEEGEVLPARVENGRACLLRGGQAVADLDPSDAERVSLAKGSALVKVCKVLPISGTVEVIISD